MKQSCSNIERWIGALAVVLVVLSWWYDVPVARVLREVWWLVWSLLQRAL